ncbi:hypothetical protein [Methylobacterium sp. B4]|uniref:hypothetical protein n=1 Tax=Methylobacterium sp. B4 TaxID=1938755 RepID=UPI0011B59312|nr:hypothetical protein [Methylobacterium sp. B4]
MSFVHADCTINCAVRTLELDKLARTLPAPLRDRVAFLCIDTDPARGGSARLRAFAEGLLGPGTPLRFLDSDEASTAALASALRYPPGALPEPPPTILVFDRTGRMAMTYGSDPVDEARLLQDLTLLETFDAIRVAGTASAAAGFAATVEEVQSVREHLRRTLASLTPRRIEGAGPALQGGPNGLRAAIGADQALERPVDLAVALNGLPRDDGRLDLVESRAPLESLPGLARAGGASEPSEVLLHGIAGFSIRYFGALKDRTRPLWYPAWPPSGDGAGRLPALVEIQVVFAPGDPRRWTPLVIALGNRR